MWTWMKGLFSNMAGKLGLILGYIAVGVSLVLGAAAIWFYKQNGDLHDSVSELTTRTATLKDQAAELRGNLTEQQRALDDLVALRKKDAQVMNGLTDAVGAISKDARQQKSMIQQLKERSDEVRSYLRTPLPASVRVVLDGKAAGAKPDNHSDADRQAPPRAAPVQGDQGQRR